MAQNPTFQEFLAKNLVFLDGASGTELFKLGAKFGEALELWNINKAVEVKNLNKGYFKAGSHVVNSLTFGILNRDFSMEEMEKLVEAAIYNCRCAREEAGMEHPTFIGFNLGPTNKKTNNYDDIVRSFSKLACKGEIAGADLVVLETFMDFGETKAALEGVREGSNLPIVLMNYYGEDKKLFSGESPVEVLDLCKEFKVEAVGANCISNINLMMQIAKDFLREGSVPVAMKANAGIPQTVAVSEKEEITEMVYPISKVDFGKTMLRLKENGVRLLGGCCGTDREYISNMVKLIKKSE